jgi:hypothetical protein
VGVPSWEEANDFFGRTAFGDLGVQRGSGAWGVSTLKLNPVTNDYYVMLFPTELQALNYARSRAAKGPAIYLHRTPAQRMHKRFIMVEDPDTGEVTKEYNPRWSPPARNPRANVYYVVEVPQMGDDRGQQMLIERYRVLRGESGSITQHGRKPGEQGHTGRLGGVRSVLVFKDAGPREGEDAETGRPLRKWQLNKALSVDLTKW